MAQFLKWRTKNSPSFGWGALWTYWRYAFNTQLASCLQVRQRGEFRAFSISRKCVYNPGHAPGLLDCQEHTWALKSPRWHLRTQNFLLSYLICFVCPNSYSSPRTDTTLINSSFFFSQLAFGRPLSGWSLTLCTAQNRPPWHPCPAQ